MSVARGGYYEWRYEWRHEWRYKWRYEWRWAAELRWLLEADWDTRDQRDETQGTLLILSKRWRLEVRER